MQRLKVVIIDMQPITPAVGGGRQRLLGLYHNLGSNIEATYVGSYDWPGESPRDQRLTEGLREICVPLSDLHHRAAQETASQMGGRVMIDIEFSEQVHLSPAHLNEARNRMRDADVVVFSHPWCFMPLSADLRADQLVVYDSQNVESVLRMSLHDDLPQASPLIELVAKAEAALLERADLVLACSEEDRKLFNQIFGTPWQKLRVVPNGIFTTNQWRLGPDEKRAIRAELGIADKPVAVFLGSGYGPNNDAAQLIAAKLAPALPDVHFVLIGGCCEKLIVPALKNVTLAGVVDDEAKQRWLRAADLALNPLADGSGTSIKMFDYMAAGLPVVTSKIGARGIETCGRNPFAVVDVSKTGNAIARIAGDIPLLQRMGDAARAVVDELYSWERISPDLGRLLRKRFNEKERPAPTFSVLIPSYERADQLSQLLRRIAQQTDDDFEVIIVDQSRHPSEPWGAADRFPVEYIHTDVRGAVKARNKAAHFASGRVLAFVDDDCLPSADWLSAARKYFESEEVVGLEGLVRSERLDDPRWRPVTNVGFEGIGFMTANLFVRNDVFHALGGFDLDFDCPHFREDTDLGWRMQDMGSVPYAADVVVFHPPQPRNIERESLEERNKFFEKDALLLSKHPEKYMRLFFAEGHYRHGAGFWENFLQGIRKYGVVIPQWMRDLDEAAFLGEAEDERSGSCRGQWLN